MNTLNHIFSRLYTGSRHQLCKDMIDSYQEQDFLTVSFVYFTNLIKNERNQSYIQAMKVMDFILPDGIALQTFWRFTHNLIGSILPNHNGTDFTPYILHYLQRQHIPFSLSLYGAKPEIVQKAAEFARYKGRNVSYVQDGYISFDRESFHNAQKPNTIPILLVARGVPLQEIRTYDNLSYIRNHRVRVMNVGGLLDFRSGDERRAPMRMRGRWERIRRVLHNPRKNLYKIISPLCLPYHILRYFLLQKR